MKNNSNEVDHRTSKIRSLRVNSAIFILCILFFIFEIFVDSVVVLWSNVTSPRPAIVLLPVPIMVVGEFPNNSSIIQWSDDGNSIHVENYVLNTATSETVYSYTRVDIDSGKIIAEEHPEVLKSFEYRDNDDSLTLYTVEFSCRVGGISIRTTLSNRDTWQIVLYQDEELIRSFAYGSDQWTEYILPPQVSGSFSQSCNKFSLVLLGWVYHEGDGHEELWLMDIPSRSFDKLLLGKTPISLLALWDYSVQSVYPSWSPNERKIVFGDQDYGLEIYDIFTRKRSLIAGPKLNLSQPVWSFGGEWIAAVQHSTRYQSIAVISPDGELLSTTGMCDQVTDISWSPVEEKLAYVCITLGDSFNSLWVWDLTSTEFP